MRTRFLVIFGVVGVAVLSLLVVVASRGWSIAVEGQEPLRRTTAWGDPDLQGIWTHEYTTPFERPDQFAGKASFTDEELVALDALRAGLIRRDLRGELGSEEDVAGAYGSLWLTVERTGRRTSLIIDPPDGRLPPVTAEVQKRRDEIRAFQLALLQATDACKAQEPHCRGGKYGPPSPQWDDPHPYYNMRSNRHNHPEELSMGWRCLSSPLPALPRPSAGVFQQIVQGPGAVSIYYDIGQGQGFQRIIPVDGRPHLSPKVRQWWGDSRGRWEGRTLVVDVTNFSDKTDFQGSRENLHLVERWTRLDEKTLEYAVTVEDPTTWTKPWTAKLEMGKQDQQPNRIYLEPRCHEGKIVDSNEITGQRAIEKAFSDGRGPHPATFDTVRGGDGSRDEENRDPLGSQG